MRKSQPAAVLILFLTFIQGCQRPHRDWDWTLLGDSDEPCLRPGDHVVLALDVGDGATVRHWFLEQVSATGYISIDEKTDSLQVVRFREGDVLTHRQHDTRLSIVKRGASGPEVSRGLVLHSGWRALASAVDVTLDTIAPGCYVHWQRSASVAEEDKIPWGTEVEIKVEMASLLEDRAVGRWRREDTWTFPFGASDQIIPPLDSLMYQQRGGFEAWCLSSLGHRQFFSSQDTAVAFRVTWRKVLSTES
jgi:hypothetical protein